MIAISSNPEKLLQRLEWSVLRRLDGLLQGDYQTLFRGFGLDLADLREYQPGDDIRFIDWNVTARMPMPYVRQYTEDREITAWFLLDLSPSVDFGSVPALKRSLLIDFVAVLSRLLTRHGNRVGAMVYSDRVEQIIPAGSGRLQVLRLVKRLLERPQAKRARPTDLAVLLESAFRALRRRSLIFILSDFFSLPGWDRPLGALSRRHEVLAIRIYDPSEQELPDVGPLLIEDAETGEQLYIDTSDEGFRSRFIDAVSRREGQLQTAFDRARVDILAISTADDLAKEIVRFAVLRRSKRRRVA
jgi:uncharacterized protein (DUF58 family)